MKTLHLTLLACAASLLPIAGRAQVNSGSDGHDGALNPASNLVIDMADHPDGIYHYTSVNIPAGVTVSFIPNAANTPVVWLVQGDVVISGWIDVSGKVFSGSLGGAGGPGGNRGGNGAPVPSNGQGPGGGGFGDQGSGASYATQGEGLNPGAVYGNAFLIPMLGGSGGGGTLTGVGGGGGGGAILIASSGSIQLTDGNAGIIARGGNGTASTPRSGSGSGGAIRLVCGRIFGGGQLDAGGAGSGNNGGAGRIRFDCLENLSSGARQGVITQGFQPIILPASGQGVQLAITSLAGAAVAANPHGVLAAPDVIIPAQQTNPVPVVVSCTNIPLNTELTVVVHPANGSDVQASGFNTAGTQASSTATIPINLPRGGGIIYAKAVTGLAGTASAASEGKTRSLAETGWTAEGERFVKMEITAALGGATQIAYLTESGKRYAFPTR